MLEYFSPSKINWTLDILGVRKDGYHEVDLLKQAISLYDNLTIEQGDGFNVYSKGNRIFGDNIIVKAAMLFSQAVGVELDCTINLRKHIPVGSGLGGGSGNAATTLVALNDFYATNLSLEQLHHISLELGADVPFFLYGGVCRARGIGQSLQGIQSMYKPIDLIIIMPCKGVSTKRVYEEFAFDEKYLNNRPDTKRAILSIENSDINGLVTSMGNVLYPTTLNIRPQIGSAINDLMREGAVAAQMTGSGTAVFGVFYNIGSAKKALYALRRTYKTCFHARTIGWGARQRR